MDNRTITVQGKGSVTTPVDYVEISLTLIAVDADYSIASEKCEEKLISLKAALTGIGFKEECLETTGYNVSAEYKSVHSSNGYSNELVGYKCSHALVLEFDFDNKTLSEVLSAVTSTISEPNLYVRFTVKDNDAVCDAAVEAACLDAANKAKLLCKATGVELGEILNITYSDVKPSVYSSCEYRSDIALLSSSPKCISISPEDIESTDDVTVTWSIK